MAARAHRRYFADVDSSEQDRGRPAPSRLHIEGKCAIRNGVATQLRIEQVDDGECQDRDAHARTKAPTFDSVLTDMPPTRLGIVQNAWLTADDSSYVFGYSGRGTDERADSG
jgi:hypothetical protein